MRRIIAPILALAASLLPVFVFAQTQELSLAALLLGVAIDDGRLIAIRIFQILWFLGFLVSLGFALYGLAKIRKDQSDILQGSRNKNLLQRGGIAAGLCLVIFLILSGVYWFVERSIEPQVIAIGGEELTPTNLKLLSEFSDYKKVLSTYPQNDQRNVARNVKILVQFSEPVLPASVMDAQGKLISDSIRITADGSDAPVDASVTVLQGNTQLVISPSELLGESNLSRWHTVTLAKKIERASGVPLFSNDRGYVWRFEVNGFIDNTPPFIESILPVPQKTLPANSLILINFSKGIDPSSVTDKSIKFIDENTKKSITYATSFGNSFKSLILNPQQLCGKNACGEPVYCFPKNAKIGLTLAAAALPPSRDDDAPNKAAFPFTGIVDAAGNSLDGGGENGAGRNGKSDGPPKDSATAYFSVGELMDTEEPALAVINPGRDKTRIGISAPIEMQFTKLIDPTTVNSESVRMTPATKLDFSISYDAAANRTKVLASHAPFTPKTLYSPNISSDVRDLSQNCFSRCLGPR